MQHHHQLNVVGVFLYLAALICACATAKLSGLHSDELHSGELVMPRRVAADGSFISKNLTYHHRHDHRRRRRAADTADADDVVHYQLKLSNEWLHLELQPHTYFMTPHMVIERHRRDLRTRSQPADINVDVDCHFQGKVRGHAYSNVAVSTCKGLVGHIKTQSSEYFIEPSKLHSAHPINGHPHVVFQRSSLKYKSNNSNNNSNSNNTNPNKRKHKHRRRKYKHSQQQQQQQQHYQIQRASNCGTKEPRRRLETRLEWQSQGKVKIQGGRRLRRQQLQHQRINQEELQLQETKIFRYQTENDTKNSKQYNKNNNSNNNNNNKNSQSNARASLTTTTTYTLASASASTSTVAPLLLSATAAADRAAAAAASISAPPLRHREADLKMTSNNFTDSHRIKRSISSPRHVETLLVADSTMHNFHGKEVTTYLLTIMNMVSALYKDPSIGNSIEIVVVRIIVLEEDEHDPDLNLTQNAQKNLDRFCGWQHKLNSANENDPHHHDVAILVTRKNICGNNCMTLGLANVGGMCKPKQSCSVNEDNGIMLSHTITHELGHNFGMFHDTAKIGCHPRVGSIVHIMTPTFGADTLQVCWSNCSRKYITHFLDQGLGDCLDDSPTQQEEFNYTEALPGVRYNAERQCQMQFNQTSEDISVGTCSAPHEICSTLWCRVNGECVTNMRPTAPGTSCGKRKWCQNGKCVRIEEQTPINGGWGNWSEWSECSRSCGGGVSTQHRDCNNPLPAHGGVFCIGERKRYKICKKKPCPEDDISFRARQCAHHNNVTYQGSIYKWQPFFDKNNPCKLFCTDEDDTIIANWGDTVLDGTPCTLGTNNMCIDGICKKVGCDWIVDSEMQEDRCGICGGTGKQCKPVKAIFGEALNVTEGYVEVVTIPAKSRHIVIRELATSPNFLGVARANSGQFYLNGDSLISMPGEFMIAGAESLYDRLDEQETIKIPQPIQHAITLYVIVRVNETNEGVYYEFTLPAVNVSTGKQYLWKLSNWTACTATCGGGVQHREPACYENDKVIVDTVPCWTNARNRRPQRQTRQCNKSPNPCPAQWWTGPWQFCPVTCKQPGTPHPVKRRSIMCLDQRDVVVSDAQCSMLPRPTETEYCDQHLPDCKTL